MTTKRRTKPVSDVQNTNPAHPITEAVSVKFTYSVKADNESLTIRTDSEQELEELMAAENRAVQKSFVFGKLKQFIVRHTAPDEIRKAGSDLVVTQSPF